jgi:hypothetical protein
MLEALAYCVQNQSQDRARVLQALDATAKSVMDGESQVSLDNNKMLEEVRAIASEAGKALE